MRHTLHTNLALVLAAALVSTVAGGSAPVQADERDPWTASGAVDQYDDAA